MPLRYTRTAIWLHWIVAALILANIALAWTWPSMSKADMPAMVNLHKSIGITVLGLAVLRLLWRLSHPAPPLPADYRPWERNLAHAVHWTFYAILFAMPLTGWIMESAWKDAGQYPLKLFGVIPWFHIGGVLHLDPAAKQQVHERFETAHGLIAYAIYALFVLHVAGALKHQLAGDRELQRMGVGRARG